MEKSGKETNPQGLTFLPLFFVVEGRGTKYQGIHGKMGE
jgi:hypothetical protein